MYAALKRRNKNNCGFTLIELLVVVAIIGLLSSVILASLNSARAKARDARRKADIHELKNAFGLYYVDNLRFPATGTTNCLGLSTGTCWGDKLIPASSSLITLLSPYIKNIPVDPSPGRGWGDAYLYLDGSTSLTGCNGSYVTGHYILYRPEDNTSNAGWLGSCASVGVTSCCGPGGAPCGTNGGYYCAVPLD